MNNILLLIRSSIDAIMGIITKWSLQIRSCFSKRFTLVLANHGIDLLLIDRVYQQAERFFSQPIEEKMKLYIGQCSYGNNRGCTPIYKEGFDLALELRADDQDRTERRYHFIWT
jgi:isopenicillin N synthase-like dioxygenase